MHALASKNVALRIHNLLLVAFIITGFGTGLDQSDLAVTHVS